MAFLHLDGVINGSTTSLQLRGKNSSVTFEGFLKTKSFIRRAWVDM